MPIKIKLLIETTTGCTFTSQIVETNENFAQDTNFIEAVKKYKEYAKEVTFKWNVNGEDESCYVDCESVDQPHTLFPQIHQFVEDLCFEL